MKVMDYIKDQTRLIVFYLIVMSFMAVFLYLEPSARLTAASLIYLLAVLLFFFLGYLLLDYFRKKRYLDGLESVAALRSEERLAAAPVPETMEQRVMDRLLRTIDDDSRKQVNRLERRIEENKDFVMSWVHEIKTPIAAGTMLIAAGKEKTKEELLDKMEDELAVISHYVEQALYFSRIDSFSNDYLIDAYPLREIVNASLKKHAKLFIGKKIRVATDGLDHRVLTDKKWLGFIVDQIISNALKYAYPGSTIKVIGRRTESAMELLISDEGRGIDGGDIGRVFEKGFTGSTGRKERRSTGMGLYLSRKLAEKLGHRLSLSSVKGKGTKVKIQIADHVDYVSLAKQKRKVTKM